MSQFTLGFKLLLTTAACGGTEERVYTMYYVPKLQKPSTQDIVRKNAPVFCSSSALIVAPGPMDSDWAQTKW